jgi:hypothetical protein
MRVAGTGHEVLYRKVCRKLGKYVVIALKINVYQYSVTPTNSREQRNGGNSRLIKMLQNNRRKITFGLSGKKNI